MTLIQHRSSHSYLASHVHTATPRGLSHLKQFRQAGASASTRELARASHSNIRAALASDTVFGGTVNRLKPFCGAVHDAGGGEALRVVLEERASACVTVVGAIATVLYSITRETPKVSRCVAANCSRSLVDQ